MELVSAHVSISVRKLVRVLVQEHVAQVAVEGVKTLACIHLLAIAQVVIIIILVSVQAPLPLVMIAVADVKTLAREVVNKHVLEAVKGHVILPVPETVIQDVKILVIQDVKQLVIQVVKELVKMVAIQLAQVPVKILVWALVPDLCSIISDSTI